MSNGAIKENFPGLDVWEIQQTCALDVADDGEHRAEAIAPLMNLSREAIVSIEDIACDKLNDGAEMIEHLGYEPRTTGRRLRAATRVLAALRRIPRSVSQIARETGLSTTATNVAGSLLDELGEAKKDCTPQGAFLSRW